MIPSFRVYVPRTKELIYVSGSYELRFTKDAWALIRNDVEFGPKVISTSEDGVLMRGTGLKDKNGFQIFEGDALERTDRNGGTLSRRFSVKWEQGIRSTGFNVSTSVAGSVCRTLSVVGNIHTTPELLK